MKTNKLCMNFLSIKISNRNRCGSVNDLYTYLWPLPFNRLRWCSSAEIQWFRLWREFRIHKESFIPLALPFELAETLIFIIIQLDHVFSGKDLSVSHVYIAFRELFWKFQKPRNHSRGNRLKCTPRNTALWLVDREQKCKWLPEVEPHCCLCGQR